MSKVIWHLVKGRIALLWLFAAFVLWCAGQAHFSAVGTSHVTGTRHLKSAHFRGRIWTLSNTWFLGPRESTSRSVQPFLHSSPVCPTYRQRNRRHRHTDHATCDICSNRPHRFTLCRRCGLKLSHSIVILATPCQTRLDCLLQEGWRFKSWNVPTIRRWTLSEWRLWTALVDLPQHPHSHVPTSANCCRPSERSAPTGSGVSWRHESSACRRTSVQEWAPSTSESTASNPPVYPVNEQRTAKN